MKVLAVGAHPDDIEIGCGGTLSKLSKEGAIIDIIVVTNGESGSQKLTKSELSEIRKKEAIDSAKILGAKQVHFMELEDGLTQFNRQDKIKMMNLMRNIRPEVLFVHARQDRFPDHEIIHKLTMNSVIGASGPWYQESEGEAHQIKRIYGYEVWNPLNEWQYVQDISDHIENKIQALSMHSSQLEDINYLEAVKGLASYRGILCSSGGYAEVFEVLRV